MATSSNGSIHEGINRHSLVRRVVAWDWYDGPTEGLLQIGDSGEVYHFRMLEEKPGSGEVDDVRVFGLYPSNSDVLDQLVAELRPFQEPRSPIWQVVWKFPSVAVKSKMDGLVETIKEHARPLVWIIATNSSFGNMRAMSIPESASAA